MKRFIAILAFLFFLPMQEMALANLSTISEDPYLAALVLDADNGKVLFEKNADTTVYPASVLKLMTLFVILDRIDEGQIRLSDMVQITSRAAKMGGSQVYLDPKEQFSVESLLYALMVQSANDAATALAIHVAGSTDGFIKLMNEKAQELGMTHSKFYSVHGLPPAKDQQVDITTARDLGILSEALVKNPQTFVFTSTKEREFRNGQFIMRTHNHLLGEVAGCDGLKTGYFKAAGFSIASTAKRNGHRVIAIVMGSKDRKVRDAKARELLEKGFNLITSSQPAIQPVAVTGQQPATGQQQKSDAAVQILETSSTLTPTTNASQDSCKPPVFHLSSFLYGFGAGLIFFLLILIMVRRKKRSPYRYSR